MFETAELGRALGKEEFKAERKALRVGLLRAQADLASAGFPVVILINGVDGAGKGKLLHRLNQWLDPRYVTTRAYEPPTDEERQRPPYWRYWMWQPPRGNIALFLGSWYTTPILERVYGKLSDSQVALELSRIVDFERTLADGGTLFIKLWLHTPKDEQERRFEKLQKSRATRWRVTKKDWKNHRHFDAFVRECGKCLRRTSTGQAPWTIIESTDRRYRDVSAARHILEAIQRRLGQPLPAIEAAPDADIEAPRTILDTLDLTLQADGTTYSRELARRRAQLNRSSRKLSKRRKSVIVVFEGLDAAGKGGAIRRITAALDARYYQVIPVAAPTDEERAHHYLWRFWRHLPRYGKFTIYDRSWYGRVLVERVEGLVSQDDGRRAYREINEFEQRLSDSGLIVVKFWLHVSRDEQLRRFEERERTPRKRHKITAEDYRNRAKRNLYELYASEMIERTSTEYAPWTLVEAEDKRFARLKVLDVLTSRLDTAL
jgi:polyphosphate:AMP phosphotransferase